MREHIHHGGIDFKCKMWEVTKPKILTSMTQIFTCTIEYLGEIETEFENIIACLSAQMGSNHDQIRVENSLPLACPVSGRISGNHFRHRAATKI